MEAQRQAQAVSEIDPYIKQVLQTMSPERQAHLKLQRSMMKQEPLFSKGLEGFNQSIQQRGTTIADIAKQDKGLEIANAKHQYKVENPIQGQGGHKLEYAIEYAGGREAFDKLPLEEKQLLMDRSARARQLVDKGVYWEDVVTGEKYDKNVGAVETVKMVGRDVGERLSNFKQNRKASTAMVQGFDDSLEALKRLDEGATAWTTGYGAFLKHLPNTDAREWFAELETVGAQTVLDTMKELKSMSQTGSTGFGAVNIKELEVMMNKWGKIDEFTDDAAIKEIIERRIEIMTKIRKRATDAAAQEEAWYRRNRYNLPQSAQELIDEETPEPMPAEVIQPPENSGFTILD